MIIRKKLPKSEEENKMPSVEQYVHFGKFEEKSHAPHWQNEKSEEKEFRVTGWVCDKIAQNVAQTIFCQK
jgi:hypothetical protein